MLSGVLGIPDESEKFPTVILLHGFTGYKDEEHIVTLQKDLVNEGFASIRFDCSGFGESEGDTEEEYRVTNYLNDIESIYEYLFGQKFVDKLRICVWGQSMGGMLSIIFGSRHSEIKAVCAVSPPNKVACAGGLKNFLTEWKEIGYFDKWSSKYGEVKIPYDFVIDTEKYGAASAIKKIKSPVLIILGNKDDTVFPDDTKKVFNNANNPKELFEIEGMNHDYKKNPEQIKVVNRKVLGFFKKYV